MFGMRRERQLKFVVGGVFFLKHVSGIVNIQEVRDVGIQASAVDPTVHVSGSLNLLKDIVPISHKMSSF